ncbi:Uma2 family endonuclease [Kamptonema sp. UHCC 0994]|uniref:Uma2 family endonuclease n=1 Tax=Kamptonema sp. UHCC 0994 TaxID=3031329 RepID=UPI0023B968CA|nr:Uma2 family endonuclease [Kamptonema sp. UHCC 0994]MDF0552871.1 Uma2 family endonuclease [Kamptonema sp. UHCC 0994]
MPSPLQIPTNQNSGKISIELLPLENGDRLTRPEFERRYHAMPELKKAELIEGVVYMGSPVRFEPHAEPHSNIIGWLWVYRSATPGVRLGDNATTRLDLDNEPQPDALLRIASGGNSSISEDGYVEGAPELVVEIAASSASYDSHDKLRMYRRNGVQEYFVWKIYNNRIDWFRLNEGEYILLEPDTAGIIRSQVFPGLWLAVSAMLEGNLAEVLAVLQQGLASPEHGDFVEQLRGG